MAEGKFDYDALAEEVRTTKPIDLKPENKVKTEIKFKDVTILGPRILVPVGEIPETTESGIVLTDEMKELITETPYAAKVGNTENVKEGDMLQFSHTFYLANENERVRKVPNAKVTHMRIDGKPYIIVHENDVVAVVGNVNAK